MASRSEGGGSKAPAKPQAAGSEESLIDTFSFVLSFLREIGLPATESALVEEIGTRFPELRPLAGPDPDAAAPDGPAGSGEALTQASSMEAAADAVPAEAEVPGAAPAASRSKTKKRHSAASPRKSGAGEPPHDAAPAFPELPPAGGDQADEYDNMDDVGYRRAAVANPELFVELEIEGAAATTGADSGGELEFAPGKSKAVSVRTSAPADSAAATPADGSDAEGASTPGSAKSAKSGNAGVSSGGGGAAVGRVPVPTPMPQSLMATLAGSGAGSGAFAAAGASAGASAAAARAGDEGLTLAPRPTPEHDDAWEAGPAGIKLCEPVTTPSTPSRSPQPERSPAEERHQTLSRVESLSSSFVDFELERMGADGASDTDEIELFPQPPDAPEGATAAAAAAAAAADPFASASMTSAPDSPASGAAPGDGSGRSSTGKRSAGGSGALTATPGAEACDADASATAPAFGFSFPVAPGPEATPPQEEVVFKTWPSASRRSSCCAHEAEARDSSGDLLESSGVSPRVGTPGSNADTADQSSKHSGGVSPGSPTSAGAPSGSAAFAPSSHELGTAGERLSAHAIAVTKESVAEAGRLHGAASGSGDERAQGDEEEREGLAAEEEGEQEEEAGEWPAGEGEGHRGERDDGEGLPLLLGVDWHDATDGGGGEEDEEDEVEDDEGTDDDGDGDDESEEPQGVRGAGTRSRAPRSSEPLLPKYAIDESGAVVYQYDREYIDRKYEVISLQVIHRRHRTGFEETKDFPIRMNDLIAGRYQVMDFLGSAAFSRAVQALDVRTNTLVCLKIVKNNKDYFDQSLDEIKLLTFVNSNDPGDEHGVVRLYDYFYYKEHLFLVCELLRANLYEFQKYNKESGEDLYFTSARIQKIARSVLHSLAYLHSLDLIHSDIKPENILIKSYSRCEVKVIDLGSSCFITDQLSSYVQSRSYRAPEVILGLPYDHKIDIWSLGCILAELSSGYVLFQNDSVATLLARVEGILGPMPEWMLAKGRYASRFYTRSGRLYEHVTTGGADRYELLTPKKSSLRHRVPDADPGLLSFMQYLLCIDPKKRPSAADALRHPWLSKEYASLDAM